ncbi:hypothetical protein [Desulfosediminicola ganghwensis]|uniref:hypothetical protein n=1 Tax=Desulfosediminicola ganghwensis TaxID=2569540 RepID=UPI0010AD93CC|nr:hypothetical protein [Desulfosediminicola ganghwensis]
MPSKLSRFKPGVQRKTHLLLAASLWTGVGSLLMWRGMRWLDVADLLILVIPAVALGFLKSRFILDKASRRVLERISQFNDGTCLGAVYSKGTWLMVIVMMVAGVLLRESHIPRTILGVLYVTVGWGLAWSSRNSWRAWFKE